MPYSSMSQVPQALRTAGLSLSQSNQWARYYDEAKASGSKYPGAIAWMRFKYKHKKVGNKWVSRKVKKALEELTIGGEALENGSRKPYYYEYFQKGGRLVLRELPVTRRAEIEKFTSNDEANAFCLEHEEELNKEMEKLEFMELTKQMDQLLPEAEPQPGIKKTFWLLLKPKDQTPYVLIQDAVKKGWMPPLGFSCMPKSDREKISKEFRFWEAESKEAAKEMRDELVASSPEEKFEKEFIPILKVDHKKHVVYGVVLEPEVWDAQKDIASTDEIEKAAHEFLAFYRKIDLRHHYVTEKCYPVESYLAPSDMKLGGEKVRKGSWILGTKVTDPKIWKDIEKGLLTGFSIVGFAHRVLEE